MKRHLIGLAIFGLIVASAVFVKAVLYAPAKKINNYTYSTNNSCWKMKRELVEVKQVEEVKADKLLVRQAVFDLNTKQMDWDLVVPETASSVALHFFVKDSKGTRYLATEFAPKSSLNKSTYDSGNFEFTSSYLWLDNLGSYKNLYVLPEMISRHEFIRKDFVPEFDENSATSVLLYSGHTGYPTEKYFRK